jgi:hypothetical protein
MAGNDQERNREAQNLRESYDARRSPNDPATLEEYMAQQNPAYADEFALSIACMFMEHTKICDLFNAMHWCVLDVPQECYPLLTSDHPVYITLPLTEDDAFLMMAIGPRRLFVATAKPETQRRLQARRPGELVKAINKLTVQHAEKFVYGLTDDMLPFVKKHMSTKRHTTLLEMLAAHRGHEIAAADSPLVGHKTD